MKTFFLVSQGLYFRLTKQNSQNVADTAFKAIYIYASESSQYTILENGIAYSVLIHSSPDRKN